MNRAERNTLDGIAVRLAASDPVLAGLLSESHDGSPGARRAAASALTTATVGLLILVAGIVASSSILTVLGLIVMIVLPAPIAGGAISGVMRRFGR